MLDGISPQVELHIWHNPYQNPSRVIFVLFWFVLFLEVDRLKLTYKFKGHRTAKNIVEKNKDEGHNKSTFRTYCKYMVIKDITVHLSIEREINGIV